MPTWHWDDVPSVPGYKTHVLLPLAEFAKDATTPQHWVQNELRTVERNSGSNEMGIHVMASGGQSNRVWVHTHASRGPMPA
jgi:hypothetical protein